MSAAVLTPEDYMQLLLARQAEWVAAHPQSSLSLFGVPLLHSLVRAEDAALVEFPCRGPAARKPRVSRPRRTVNVAALQAERDRLIEERDAVFGVAGAPERAAAWMNTGTAAGRTMSKAHAASTDRALADYAALDRRITLLSSRIMRASRSVEPN